MGTGGYPGVPVYGSGLAWALGIDGVVDHVVAVIGNRVIIRDQRGTWRAGTYGDPKQADAAAIALTRDMEERVGMVLLGGPVEFPAPSADGRLTQSMKIAISLVLALGEPVPSAGYASLIRCASIEQITHID